jgi:hypothetical protein
MSKSKSRTVNTTAMQKKIAEQRAAEARRRQIRLAATGIGVVIALFAVLIIVKVAGGNSTKSSTVATPSNSSVTAQVVSEVTSVPASTFSAVGAGGVAIPTKAITGAQPLTSGGKPEIVYMGAEYCPYCAAERWPLIVALSRFGTFNGLALTASSSTDVYPSTNTFTFLKSTYTSQYITFTPVELQDVNHNNLQTPTAAEQQLLNTYDAAPYVSSEDAGAIPFVDFGNQFMLSGASYSPQTLAGMTWSSIASTLTNASSPVAQSIDGTANQLTAAICKMTNDQPASVCSTSTITGLQAKL